MTLRLSQYSAPTAEPISLTEAKIHLRLATDTDAAESYTNEDDLLNALISATSDAAEVETWRSVVLQGFDLYLDGWPSTGEIELPKTPLRKVDFVRYTDVDGELREFEEYTVDQASTYGRIVLNDGESWPSDTLRPNNPIHIRFWVGELVPFSADATTDIITAQNHPFTDGDKVRLSVTGGELPGGLTVKTDYFVVNEADGSLQLASSDGGAPIDITSAGTGTMFIGERPAAIINGMKLLLIGMRYGDDDMKIANAASYWFSMAALKRL